MKTFSDFEILLNTPDPAVIREMIDKYPISGFASNPQMISTMNRPDFEQLVKELREAARDRKLFIQTPSNDYEGIMKDAYSILKVAGQPTIIKVPSTAGGIKAISDLTAQGIDVCATQVMSSLQGILALQAGAKYVATFYCFMGMGGADENGLYSGVDADAVFKALKTFRETQHCEGKIMACAPRTPDEMSYLFASGASAIILDPIDFDNCFNSRHFMALNKNVRADWEKVYGDVAAYDLIK